MVKIRKMVLKISTALKNYCVKALSESMDIRTMNHLIKNLIPDYDIYKQTGYPSSMAIPNIDVARQIALDIIKTGKFLSFVQALVSAQDDGIMGRKYPISFLREIIKGTYDLGFIFDSLHIRVSGLSVDFICFGVYIKDFVTAFLKLFRR